MSLCRLLPIGLLRPPAVIAREGGRSSGCLAHAFATHPASDAVHFRWVDSVSVGAIDVPVLFFQRSPSIAAFEERTECGARQLASRWSAGRRRAPRKGPRP